jgi:hypothetical protein
MLLNVMLLYCLVPKPSVQYAITDSSKFCLYTNWKGLSLSVIIHYIRMNVTFNYGNEVQRFGIFFFDYSKKNKNCLVVASDRII